MNVQELTGIYNIKIRGSGSKPMLFAHGLACDQNIWYKIWPAFEEDYRIILFDFIGSGNSNKSVYSKERYSHLDGYAQDILDICEALQLTDVVFVGHSVSCMAGILAAVKRPDLFSRLILIGPSPCYINKTDYYGGFERSTIEQMLRMMKEDFVKWTQYFAPVVMGNPQEPRYAEELQQIFCKADPAIICDFAEVAFFSDNRDDLPKLQVPSAILQASQDVVAPKNVGEYMHRYIRNAQLYHMLAVGHCPHVSAPEETVAKMKHYLSEYK